MESILNQLYDGEIYPAERFFPNSQEYIQAGHFYNRIYQDFLQALKEQAPALLEPLKQLMGEKSTVTAMEIEESFLDGFCLGVKLTAAVYERG